MRSVNQLELQLLPALFNPRGILGAIVLTQILCAILAFSPLNEGDPWLELGLVSLLAQSVFLFSLLIVSFAKAKLERLSLTWLLLTLLGVALLSTFFISQAALYLELVNNEHPLYFVLSNLLICILFVAIFLLVLAIYAENMRKIELLSQARYTALQARMHPHFLFNSLNNAAELIYSEPVAAEQMLIDLAHLSRSALMEREVVSLRDEVDVAKAFINIEKWRLGERLVVNWQIEEALLDIQVPSFILQPLLENAVIHGIQPNKRGGCIDIAIEKYTHGTQIQVSNPFSKELQKQSGNGIALENLKARLALYYQQANLLTIDAQSGMFIATITIPRRVQS